MKVVILCGGYGIRLSGETEFRPKPLVEVGGRPILWHIMKLYAHYGFTEFILCLGYRANMIKDYFLNYEAMNNDFTINLGEKSTIEYHGAHKEQNFTVTLVDTGLDSMTGSRVKQIERYIDGDNFMLTYGDGLSDVDVRSLVKHHEGHRCVGTVTAVQPNTRYGILNLDNAGLVRNFSEKPKVNSWVNAGYFVFRREFFKYLDEDASCILEKEPLQNLSQDGQLNAYYHTNGFFFGMDTQREYNLLNKMYKEKDTPWMVWKN